MEKIKYQILRKNIPTVFLVSTTGQTWYDYNDVVTPWSGLTYFGPSVDDIVYNLTTGGTLSVGYYKWDGSFWNNISKPQAYDSFNIPLYLDSSLDELGGFVGFDGGVEQVEQLVNFSYTQTGQTIQIYSTTNPLKLRKIVEFNFIVDWGDGNTDILPINNGVPNSNFPTLTHTYSLLINKPVITITFNSPWTIQVISKVVEISPSLIFTGSTINPMGTFTGLTVPAYINLTGQTQDYLNDLDYTNNTGFTPSGFTYIALGKSRISEKKLYGANIYSGVTTQVISGQTLSGYTIDNLDFLDYPDGYTMITGTTSDFTKEEIFNQVLTRNEHFLGFVDEPTIYSDVFVERGKQNVLEKNFRLSEIDSVGELNVYGNGYFTIKKQ